MLKAIVTKVCAMLRRADSGLAPDRIAEPSVTPGRLATAAGVPTIEAAALPTVPTPQPDAMPTVVVGTSVAFGRAPSSADYRRQPHARRSLTPERAASAFLGWLRTLGLDDRAWAVDDVWRLASVDFALTIGVTLPPRNRFLGTLQKLDGVRVQYDKRIWLHGRKVKTTVYTFTSTKVDTSALQAECGPATPARTHDRRAA
jgi:hypothetical protein